MVSQIKLTGSPNQTMKVTVPGDNRNLSLTLTFQYNTIAKYWIMGVYDTPSGQPIVVGIPLLCGHDLLGQYQYLRIGSAYIVNIGDPTIETPNETNIADNFILVWTLI